MLDERICGQRNIRMALPLRAEPTTTWSASDLSYYGCPPNTDNNAEDCAAVSTLGYMYQWSAAMNNTTTAGAQGICPSGWHIPTDGEQNTLDQYLKTGTCDANRSGLWDCDPAGTKLSSYTLNGTNSSGFSGLLAGYRNTASPWFGNRGTNTYFWSSAQSGSMLGIASVFQQLYGLPVLTPRRTAFRSAASRTD